MKRLTYIFVLFPVLLWSQFSIKGTFAPAENYKWVILYKVNPQTTEYLENKELDSNGSFEFKMDSLAKSGMYRIVYAVPQEEFNFDLIYNAKEDITFKFNGETGVEFVSSTENQLMDSYTYNMGLISQAIGEYFKTQSTDTTALANIFKAQEDTQTEFERIGDGTIAGNFIYANRPYIPSEIEDIGTYIGNLKTHFFDNVDFKNEVLQSSNFLIERTLNYVFGMSTQDLDENENYQNNIQEVVKKLESVDNGIKSRILKVLWEQFADAGNELLANQISNDYLMPLAKDMKDNELISSLNTFKRLSLGEVAPNFSFELQSGADKTSSSVKDLEGWQNYIILFWSSTCGHCLEEIPQLYAYLESEDKKDIKVIAVGLEDNSFRWRTEKMKYPDFIHVLGLGKWQNYISNSYNVTETPSYFLLDSDKKIIGKPFDFSELKKLLETQK